MARTVELLRIALERERRENEKLRAIAVDLHWMARRYVNGRQSYATSLFNEHVRDMLKLLLPLNPTGDGFLFATDGMGPRYAGLTAPDFVEEQRYVTRWVETGNGYDAPQGDNKCTS